MSALARISLIIITIYSTNTPSKREKLKECGQIGVK